MQKSEKANKNMTPSKFHNTSIDETKDRRVEIPDKYSKG
jgi:hypothetical protein